MGLLLQTADSTAITEYMSAPSRVAVTGLVRMSPEPGVMLTSSTAAWVAPRRAATSVVHWPGATAVQAEYSIASQASNLFRLVLLMFRRLNDSSSAFTRSETRLPRAAA